MPGEGKDGEGTPNPDAEEVKPDAEGKHPENVPWNKYVGIKESLGGKLTKAQEEVNNLKEQLKNAPNADEHTKTSQELEDVKNRLKVLTDEYDAAKTKSVSEMRETLKKVGVPEDKLTDASEAELKRLVDVLGGKPKSLPDIAGGGGGGGVVPTGSPLKIAREAYEQSSKK